MIDKFLFTANWILNFEPTNGDAALQTGCDVPKRTKF